MSISILHDMGAPSRLALSGYFQGLGPYSMSFSSFKLKKECHGGARKRTKAQILAKRAPGCTVPAVDSDFE